jgi:hypothetical protein
MKPSPQSFNQSGFPFYKSPSLGGGKGVECLELAVQYNDNLEWQYWDIIFM